jgi:transcriptional regulator with XRE-family HTH domain
MKETINLLRTLRRLLKARGYTYIKVAAALQVSEPTVKRLFASGSLSLDRLGQLAALVDMTLLELASEAAAHEPPLSRLTRAQESELVAQDTLLLVAVCVLNHWSAADIVAAYRVSDAQCLQCLLKLDKLRLLDLLPGNRVRLNVTRDFDWLPDGPIHQFFQVQAQSDFIGSSFGGAGETLVFAHGMLTAAKAAEFQVHLRRLRQQFAELHQESLAVPLAQRRGTGLLLAMRVWEPKGFEGLRRG